MPSMVYIMTNGDAVNQVVAFERHPNGTLTFAGAYSTQGKGTGTREVSTATRVDGIDTLASQGSLCLSPDGRFLFAVNAGSNSVSSFAIAAGGEPVLVDVKPSGGAQPNSLDVHRDLLYVSNVGVPGGNVPSNISGFRIAGSGQLTPIPGSTHFLTTPTAQPARVVFTPDGSMLVVSEYTTNRLSVFRVNPDGTVTGQTINASNGRGPFGAAFLSSGILLVTEETTNALSSYFMGADGILRVISGSVPNGQATTCWVVPSRDERFAYTTNTLGGTISTYRVGGNGLLSLVGHVTSTPPGTAAGLPIDAGVSQDGRNFYTLNGNQGTVSAFAIQPDGTLAGLQVAGWPYPPYLGSQGLAVL